MSAYSAWSWFFQLGLYGILIRAQFNFFAVHYPVITAIAMWIVLALVPLSTLFKSQRKHEFQLSYDQLAQQLKLRSAALAFWLLVSGALAYGCYAISKQLPSIEQAAISIKPDTIQADSLLSVSRNWFTKVSIDGDAVPNSRVLEEDALHEGTTVFRRYIPIRDAHNSQSHVHFVELLRSDSVQRINRAPVEMTGYVLPRAVPVLVRQSFTQDGLVLAKYAFVIGQNPVDGRTLFRIATAILLLVSLFLLLALLQSPFHNRHKLQAQRAHQGREQHVDW
ncbi:hypothetical protein GCM10008090_32520 [Arenicella chitinivorans]|uniref:Uncharacterized protein n=2 Tax=Arenicella chitinivorans TaxID=1329800 RepID=A0A918S2P6_9GAMM|nr:hypothetical protein GCM10008090_32520 [Arenicella chitinivorans]